MVHRAIEAHRGHIAGETLAERLTVGHGAPFAGTHREELVLDGEPLALRLSASTAIRGALNYLVLSGHHRPGYDYLLERKLTAALRDAPARAPGGE